MYIGRLDEIRDASLQEKVSEYYQGESHEQLIIESLLGEGTVISPVTKYTNEHLRIFGRRTLPSALFRGHDGNTVRLTRAPQSLEFRKAAQTETVIDSDARQQCVSKRLQSGHLQSSSQRSRLASSSVRSAGSGAVNRIDSPLRGCTKPSAAA